MATDAPAPRPPVQSDQPQGPNPKYEETKTPDLAPGTDTSRLEDQAVDSMEEFSILVNRSSAKTTADQLFGFPAGDLLTNPAAQGAALQNARDEFYFLDGDGNGKLDRKELQASLSDGTLDFLNDTERYLLQDFARISGGANSISKADLERAFTGAMISSIERGARAGSLGTAEREAIINWGGMPANAAEATALQEKLNTALEGTGIEAKVELSQYKNIYGENVPVSTITLTKDGKQFDQFAYARGIDAHESMMGGKSVKNMESLTLLDHADPSKYVGAEADLVAQSRALLSLLLSKDELAGGITVKEAAVDSPYGARANFNRQFLQDNFARLAMLDGDGKTVSSSDLRTGLLQANAALARMEQMKLIKNYDHVSSVFRMADMSLYGGSVNSERDRRDSNQPIPNQNSRYRYLYDRSSGF